MKLFFGQPLDNRKKRPETQPGRSIDKTAERKFFFLLTVIMLVAGIIYKIVG